jgi:molybdopterin-binding protein
MREAIKGVISEVIRGHQNMLVRHQAQLMREAIKGIISEVIRGHQNMLVRHQARAR